MKQLWNGLAAGMVGTTALNMVSYGDMLMRGRPPSEVPKNVAAKLVERVAPGSTGDVEKPTDGDGDKEDSNRMSALGALLGYANGVGIGAAYGVVRPWMRAVPWPIAGLALALGAMLASDVPATTLKETDPTTWDITTWVADIVPHGVYGLATALAFERMQAGRG